MLNAGSYHTLKVNRISDYGLYLIDDEENEVLLPNRYTSLGDKVGDMKDVFVYHDSENRLVATTEHPLATAGQAAYLEVVDKNIHGAFLDWGITAKDLFIPNSNQIFRLEPGKKYIVYVYRDNVSGRVVATTKLNGFISNETLTISPRQEVDILLAKKLDMGYRVVINGKHWGMIYDNQIFREVSLGDTMKAYIRKITEDNRVDLSLQQEGFDEVKTSADKLLKLIEDNGGSLNLGDKSDPEEVARITNMSKKVFKRSLGYLLSRNMVKADNERIILVK